MLLTIAATSCKARATGPAIATDDSTATEDLTLILFILKNTIQPIINVHLVHIVDVMMLLPAEDGVILDTYANIIQTGKSESRKTQRDSKLYKVLVENDPDDIMPPPPGSPLSSVQINDIYQWILQGSKNNECLGCDSVNVTFAETFYLLCKPFVRLVIAEVHHWKSFIGAYDDVSLLQMTGQLVGAVTHAGGYFTMPDKEDSTKYIPNCK